MQYFWTSHFGQKTNFKHVKHHKKLNSLQTSNCSCQDYYLYTYSIQMVFENRWGTEPETISISIPNTYVITDSKFFYKERIITRPISSNHPFGNVVFKPFKKIFQKAWPILRLSFVSRNSKFECVGEVSYLIFGTLHSFPTE